MRWSILEMYVPRKKVRSELVGKRKRTKKLAEKNLSEI